MKTKKKKSKGERQKILHQNLVAYSFLAPSLIGVICFSLIPLVISLYVSLTDWNFTQGIGNWNFVGLTNFKNLWTDEWFIASVKNTLLFTIVTVPIGLFLAIVIAVLIDEFCHKKVAGVVRVAMYMPHICNIVAISVVWMALYSKYGPFTQLMRALGWQDPPRFLASYEWALPSIMLVVIWASLGYRVFMYSAAITGLPRDLYEDPEVLQDHRAFAEADHIFPDDHRYHLQLQGIRLYQRHDEGWSRKLYLYPGLLHIYLGIPVLQDGLQLRNRSDSVYHAADRNHYPVGT